VLVVRPNLLLPSGPDRTLAALKFDCVLADMPSTGALNSSNLHRIARRGLEVLVLVLLVQVRLTNPICATDQYDV
jgi:hypothetical protein